MTGRCENCGWPEGHADWCWIGHVRPGPACDGFDYIEALMATELDEDVAA